MLSTIPLAAINPASAYDIYNNEVMHAFQGGHSGYSPIYRMKEVLISWAIFGEGNSYIQKNDNLLKNYRGFVDILGKLLPDSLGFINISIRQPEVVLHTKTGDFMIDAASGGILTLIDLAWRIYMFSLGKDAFVVTMDEPENHLHPSMQRSLMRRLLDAFPTAQFIIATHSPFMVSSVKDSNVYVLRYRDVDRDTDVTKVVGAEGGRRFVSEQLDTINKAGSASEILRDVLGVPATVPEWVEEAVAGIVGRYREFPLTDSKIKELRVELTQLGYGEMYPTALSQIIQSR